MNYCDGCSERDDEMRNWTEMHADAQAEYEARWRSLHEAAQGRIVQLERELDRLVGVVRRDEIQWAVTDTSDRCAFCPICGGRKPGQWQARGHAPDCELAAAIKEEG